MSPLKEDRLREVVFAEIDAELDKPYDPEEDFDIVYDLKNELKDYGRGFAYSKAKEVTAQLIRLMMDIARGV